MIAGLLLLAIASPSVADAERAFAAAAHEQGQWTAFRAIAASDAIMYAPGPVNARRFLAGKTDPSTGLQWRPAHTLTSCDGSLAYSTGPWSLASGKAGSFGTIWRHDARGWAWIYDNGHDGGALAAAPIGVVTEDHAACPAPIGAGPALQDVPDDQPVPVATLRSGALAGLIEASDGPMPIAVRLGSVTTEGASLDRTLRWRINFILGGETGAHLLRLWSWDGRRYRLAVLDVSTGS